MRRTTAWISSARDQLCSSALRRCWKKQRKNMVSPGNCSQIMTSISPTFKKEVGKCVFIHPNQFIISLFSSLITDTIPLLLKSTQIFYSCSYTLASTHDLSQLHNTSHVHIHPPDHACPLTSMCSLVRSHGRWARILLSSPSCCNFCGASFKPSSHLGSPPTWRKSLTCRLTK